MPRIVHFDLPADDTQRAINFYESVFGWKFDKWGGPTDYWLINTGPDEEPGIHGGLAPRQENDPGIVNTVGVPSVDEAVVKIKEQGGKVLRPKSAIPGVGWLAYCRDTEGNDFGIMEDDPEAK